MSRSVVREITAAAVLVATCWVAWQAPALAHEPSSLTNPEIEQAAEVGGPFSLTDHTERRVSSSELGGQILLVYFGYTYCPDICPVDVQSIAAAMDLLGSDESRVKTAFITIDPERDTPQRLSEWLHAIHPGFVGLTGSALEIEKVGRLFGVEYERISDGRTVDYTHNHPGLIYLLEPDGHVLTLVPSGTAPEALAATLQELLTDQ